MEITEKELIEKLETIAKEDNLLKTDVCEYLLDQEKDCILSHWKDVLQYDCSGGLVKHLIYYFLHNKQGLLLLHIPMNLNHLPYVLIYLELVLLHNFQQK